MTAALPSCCRSLLPLWSERAARLVAFLARAAARMDGPAASAWRLSIHDLYGDLSGQRALDGDPVVRRLLAGRRAGPVDLIVALHTYYALLCNGLAAGRAALSRGVAHFTLEELATGGAFRRLGVQPAADPLPYDWFLGAVAPGEAALFRDTLADLAALCDPVSDGPDRLDLPQRIYMAMMPKNLLHIMGEFYTPAWMARLLLEDARWRPGRSLVDPFAGSGVFLLAAIEQGRRHGLTAREVLPDLRAIDRNPAAFVALRANLILALSRDPGGLAGEVVLPICCADSLFWEEEEGKRRRGAEGKRERGEEEKRAGPSSPLPLCPSAGEPADVLVTNPPWVGWEYVARPYRDWLVPLWRRYDLFTARGRDAAFLKEDLSTLALVAAWDRFLKVGGASAVVVRPAAMRSTLAARGLRRLSIRPDSAPLALRLIREFHGVQSFAGTDVPAAAWRIDKGAPTEFPVPVVEWRPVNGRRPRPFDSLADVRPGMAETRRAAVRDDPADPGSPWVIGDADCLDITDRLCGSNPYRARAGVFTGGANAVYYLQKMAGAADRYSNVVARAKRCVTRVDCEIEDELIYEIVRGRDLTLWNAAPGALLLCPHTAETGMRPIPPDAMRSRPKALAYLRRMRPALEARRGFAGWERSVREEAFYAIQRVGKYTFAPYKTAWRYVAADFTVAVVGPGPDGRPRLCNDKIMYVAFDREAEAYFLCGLLSADPVRWRVVSAMTGTQISASAIRRLNLPAFRPDDPIHAEISRRCRQGHGEVESGRPKSAAESLAAINRAVARLYGLTGSELLAVQRELRRMRPADRFEGSASRRLAARE